MKLALNWRNARGRYCSFQARLGRADVFGDSLNTPPLTGHDPSGWLRRRKPSVQSCEDLGGWQKAHEFNPKTIVTGRFF